MVDEPPCRFDDIFFRSSLHGAGAHSSTEHQSETSMNKPRSEGNGGVDPRLGGFKEQRKPSPPPPGDTGPSEVARLGPDSELDPERQKLIQTRRKQL
ncbi:hypothetical protein V6N13_004901 [Hibiscus sabdariffa]